MCTCFVIPSSFRHLTLSTAELCSYGGYGRAFKAIDRTDRSIVAVKITRSTQLSEAEDLFTDVHTLRACADCDGLVQLKGAYLDARERELWLVLEYCEAGSLANLMHVCETKLSEDMVAIACRQVLESLHHLHSLALVHREVRCSNILLSARGDVKLGAVTLSTELPMIQSS